MCPTTGGAEEYECEDGRRAHVKADNGSRSPCGKAR
jgi:hypothetical protein